MRITLKKKILALHDFYSCHVFEIWAVYIQKSRNSEDIKQKDVGELGN